MPIHKKTIGILGGGQLARMLALKARQMGLPTAVLSAKNTDPAARVASFWIKGNERSEKDIRLLLANSDILTFESEFIPAFLLKRSLKSIPRKKVYPSLKCLGRLQDRLQQKEWLCDYGLPTLDHIKINSKEDIFLAFEAFHHRLVLKRRTGGYDGYGTYIIKNIKQLNLFLKHFKGEENQFIIEPFVDFQSERSLIFARSANGQIVQLPMIQSVQKNNQCDYTFGPTTHPLEKNLSLQIQNFLRQVDYVGVIAFELFEVATKTAKLLTSISSNKNFVKTQLVINEIAPRVHNTGHFSQEALNIDQFELHLRCLLGLRLPEIHLRQPAFVMANLLGQSTRKPLIKKFPTGALHWYEKIENRKRRKMGHINYIGKNQKNLIHQALLERKGILL